MWRLRNHGRRRLRLKILAVAVACCAPFTLSSFSVSQISGSPTGDHSGKANGNDKDKVAAAQQPPTVRWNDGQTGSTFSPDNDGKYRYGLWSGDVGVVLAVDAREVQIIRHRIEPIFGVLLTIHYRGAASLEAGPEAITMQFVKHFNVVQSSLDPDDYSQKIQADADAFDDETRRETAKHPHKKAALEARLQDYQKSVNELIEFLSRDSLRPAHLDRAHPEVNGWVFFNTKTKWLGGWKAQEKFILRLPLDGKIFEFPFELPPQPGELLLRQRP
jgi:hypothetical protein